MKGLIDCNVIIMRGTTKICRILLAILGTLIFGLVLSDAIPALEVPPLPHRSTNGITFAPLGPLVPLSGLYVFHMTIDLRTYHTAIARITARTEAIRKITQDELRHYAELGPFPEGTSQELRMINQSLNSITEAMVKADALLRNYLNIVPRRNRRALIGVGGDLLKFIFGSATETDVRALDDKIAALAGDQAAMKAAFTDSLQVLNASLAEITSIGDTVRHLENNLETLRHTVEQSTKRLGRVFRDVHAVTLLNVLCTQAGLAAENVALGISQLKTAFERAQEGHLDPFLVTPTYLRNLLTELQGHLKRRLPLIVSDAHMGTYFSLIHTTLKFLSDGRLELCLLVPLRAMQNDMELYQVDSLPVPLPTPHENVFVKIQLEEAFLGVATNQDYFLPLPHLADCRELEEIFYCGVRSTLHTGKSPLCAIVAYLNRTSTLPHCNKVMVSHFPSVYIRHGDKFLYAVPARERVLIRCPPNSSRRKEYSLMLEGAGVFELPGKCTAIARNQVFPSHRNYETEVANLEMKFTYPEGAIETALLSAFRNLTDVHIPRFNKTMRTGINLQTLSAFLHSPPTWSRARPQSLEPEMKQQRTWLILLTAVVGILIVYIAYHCAYVYLPRSCQRSPAPERDEPSMTTSETTQPHGATSSV